MKATRRRDEKGWLRFRRIRKTPSSNFFVVGLNLRVLKPIVLTQLRRKSGTIRSTCTYGYRIAQTRISSGAGLGLTDQPFF